MNVITTVNSHPISINPVFFEIGPLQLRWYGLMYSISFLILIFVLRRERRQGFLPLPEVAVERLFLGLIGGVLIGARVFYVIFYAPELILDGPLEWIAIWHGGLSFHGGLSGVLAVSYYFAKRHKISWFSILDTLALVAPLGIGLGRIGNFINGELWGRVTDVPWAMVFETGGPEPRHPSQLYESALEGWLLAAALWSVRYWLGRRSADTNGAVASRRTGLVSSLFLLGYGFARFICEFFRQPDAQLGFILGPFTMGQLLTVGVILGGIAMLWFTQRKQMVVAKVK